MSAFYHVSSITPIDSSVDFTALYSQQYKGLCFHLLKTHESLLYKNISILTSYMMLESYMTFCILCLKYYPVLFSTKITKIYFFYLSNHIKFCTQGSCNIVSIIMTLSSLFLPNYSLQVTVRDECRKTISCKNMPTSYLC